MHRCEFDLIDVRSINMNVTKKLSISCTVVLLTCAEILYLVQNSLLWNCSSTHWTLVLQKV